MKRRIAIVASHPVQYHAHWYRALAHCAGAGSGSSLLPSGDAGRSGAGRIRRGFQLGRAAARRLSAIGFCETLAKPGVSEFWRHGLARIARNSDPRTIRRGGCFGLAYEELLAGDSGLLRVRHPGDGAERFASARPVRAETDAEVAPYRYFISPPRCLSGGAEPGCANISSALRRGPERVFIVPHSGTAPVSPPDLQTMLCGIALLGGIWRRTLWSFLFGKVHRSSNDRWILSGIAEAAASELRVHGLLAGEGPLRVRLENLAEDIGRASELCRFSQSVSDAGGLCRRRCSGVAVGPGNLGNGGE